MKFIALNKKNKSSIGDAFYYETVINGELKKVLVDGGRSKDGFTNLLINETRVDILDIVACTHDDADHTYGIINLLQNYPKVKVRELWLPVSWAHYEDVIKDYKGDIEKFKEDLKSPRIYKFIKKPSEYKADFENDFNFENQEYFTEELADYSWKGTKEFLINFQKEIDSNGDTVIDGVIRKVYHTLNNIFHIANLASENNVSIRWMEYQEVEQNDILTYENELPLIPLNSKRVFYIRKKSEPLLYLLKKTLSKVNAESLVFCSNSDCNGRILFTADSNLEKNEMDKLYLLNHYFPQNYIITVPHHGSKNNEIAYLRIMEYLVRVGNFSVKWVCGQNNAVTLGDWYINRIENCGEKYCTLCAGESLKFISTDYEWVAYHSILKTECTCMNGVTKRMYRVNKMTK